MKKFLDKKECLIFVSILAMFLTSTIYGLGDWDFRWQTYSGQMILTRGIFNGIDNLVWGTLGIGHYLDHEWLTNIIFYLLNVVFGPVGSIIAFKVIVEILLSISTYVLIKQCVENVGKITNLTYIYLIILVYIFAVILVKPKAYNISATLMMFTLVLLEKYKEHSISFKKFSVYTLLIVILWNNLHSGSVLFLIPLYGAYWLFVFRDKKIILLGLASIFALLINPYGYNLIVFDIQHFFDSVMKVVVKDWHYLDTTYYSGVAIIVIIMITILLCINLNFKEDLVYVILFLGTLFMVISSMRHFIYMFPIVLMILMKCQIKDFIKIKGNLIAVLTCICCVFTCVLLVNFIIHFEDNRVDFTKYIIDDELKELLLETNRDNNGLYSSELVQDIGLKSFTTGMFPQTRERMLDGRIMLYGSDIKIETIIEKYGLTKFLFFNSYEDETGFLLTYNLYDYLIQNDDYVLIYSKNNLVYFVRKDILNETF